MSNIYLEMNEKMLIRRIEINPDIMLGKAVIKGTRLPVELIVEKIAYGATTEEILMQYPFVEKMIFAQHYYTQL